MKQLFVEQCGIYIPQPENYSDCMELVKSDWFRLTGSVPSNLRVFVGLRHHHTAFIFWLRFSSFKSWLYPLCYRFYRHYSKKYTLLIEPETKIGYGLYLGHYSNIVVNPTAIIGNNVNLSQFSTIGSNEEQAAIIGDDVYLGPSVCIVEDVVVGSGATVGAGAVVVKDVPERATVAGVPAKVISMKLPSRFIKNKYCKK